VAGLDSDLSLDVRQAITAAGQVGDVIDQVTRASLVLDVSGATSAVEGAIDQADTTVQVTPDASAVTGGIDSAVDAADTNVPVTADASSLTGSIDSAVDASDTDVEVTANAGALTGSIDSAVDAADSTVEIEGEVRGITGAIDSAVDAADTTVGIDADSSSLREARGDALDLNSALIASSQSGLQLRTILQIGAVGGAVEGVRRLVDAASDLEQAVGGTSAVFGPAERQVSSFARGASEAAGLTEESARTLTSQLGGLLQGFGFTQQEAAELSITLAQLGADLAATFGGTSQEAVQALGAALRGEFDPLERFGVSLNVTQANLKAVELGLADSTANVDLNARAQASLALIMERSANAQGQFARESNTTAGQLERLRAEAGNAAAEVGETLQPAINELIASGRSELIPALRDLAIEFGPALASAILSLAPALGVATDLLLAAAPVVRLFAAGLDAIPDPVLQAVAVLLLLRRVGGTLSPVFQAVGRGLANMIVPSNAVAGALNTAGGATSTFRGQLGNLVGGISPATFALAALVVGITAYANAQAKKAQQARELAAQEQAFQDAMTGSAGAVDGLRGKLDELVQSSADFEASTFTSSLLSRGENFRTLFADAGATVDGFTEALAAGGPELDRYLDALRRAGGEEAAASVVALRDLAGQLEDQARASIEAGIATDDYSASQARAAIENTKASDGSRNYVAALQVLQDQAARSAEQQEALAAATRNVDAEGQTSELNALGLTLEALQSRAGGVPRKFVDFALAADEAGLSGAELDAVAEELGVTSEGLQSAIEGTAAPIRELAAAAQQTIPSVSDLAGNIDEFSVSGFRDRLGDALTAVVEFQDNLQALADRPRVAAAAATLGPDFAAELADAARQGKDGVLNEIELLLAGLEGEGVNLNNLITGQIGPNLVTGTGLVGQQMTNAFGVNFNPEPAVQSSMGQAGAAIDAQAPVLGGRASLAGQAGVNAFRQAFGLAPAANSAVQSALDTIQAREGETFGVGASVGRQGTAGFGSGFTPQLPASDQAKRALNVFSSFGGPARGAGLGVGQQGTSGFGSGMAGMAGQANTQTGRAKAAIDAFRGAFGASGAGSGGAVAGGFRSGTAPMPGISSDAVKRSVQAARGAGGGAREAGSSVGSSMGSGVASGINSQAGAAEAAARNLVARAKAAMQSFAKIFSPSRLFRDEVGAPIGEGVAIGIDDQAAATARAAADLVALAAASAAAQAATATIPLPPVTFTPGTTAAANAAAAAAAAGPGAGVPPGGGGDLIVQSLTLILQTAEPITEEAGAAWAAGFRRTIAGGDARFAAKLGT
jgi:hypothetical protein